MTIKQVQNFDTECKEYNQMLARSIKNTGFNLEYLKEYKVIDFKNELEKRNIKPLRILDFGCGIGYSIPYLRKHFENISIYACDYSKESIIRCIENNKDIDNIYIKESDGINLPFEEKFDAIFISNVIRHIPRQNQKAILENLNKSLNENGIIMMFEFNPYNPVAFYYYYKEDRNYDPDNARIMSPNYAKKLFKSANFKILDINYRFFVPSCFKNLLWIEKYLIKCPIGANYYIVAKK